MFVCNIWPSALAELLPHTVSLSEQRKLALLPFQTLFNKSSVLKENISLRRAKYPRSLRDSRGITQPEGREVGFPSWISRLIPRARKMLWSPHKDCCWQTLHKQDSDRHCHKGPHRSLSPCLLSAEEGCNIWMWMAHTCWRSNWH